MPLDSDGDSLTDAFENLVSKTNPQLRDSNGNGVEDGDELSPNGVPWRLEIARRSQVVVYTTQATTTEGGGCGQFRVLLPQPAPAGGITVQYRLGGTAIYTNELTVSPTAGSITIPHGSIIGNITTCAINNTTYDDLDRYVEITLTNATGGLTVNQTPAVINLLDNDPPALRVFALPTWIREPSATYGTNAAMFYFIRDGAATNALTVNFSISGSASNGLDFVALTNSITFPVGVRTVELPVSLRADNLIEPDETIVVSLNSVSGYQLDPTNSTATLTIAANGVSFPTVQVVASDDDAREAGLNPGQFTFFRTGDTSRPLRVFYQTSGTASVGSTNSARDYVALPGYVDIQAGNSNAVVPVIPLDDVVSEVMEMIIVTLAAGDYQIGTSNTATVYLDDNEPTSYFTEIVRTYGIYGQGVNQPTEIKVTRYGTALSAATLGYTITASPALNNFFPSGDANGVNVLWAARQSVATFGIRIVPVSYSATLNASCQLRFPSLSQIYTLIYAPPRSLLYVQPYWTTNEIVEGTANRPMVRITRPYADNSSLNVTYVTRGSATNLIDYALPNNGQVLIPANATIFDVYYTAYNDSLIEGWETAVFELQPNTGAIQVPAIGYERAFIRIKDAQAANPKADSDMDADEIPDGYELSHGMNALAFDSPIVDHDRDGIFLSEEIQLGTDPDIADAPPLFPSEEETDYVPLTLRIGAAGKLAIPVGCAACHDTGINAGGYLRTTPRTSWEASSVNVDHLLRFLRGTNYPISLLCKPTGKVLPSSQTNAPPHTYSAKYSAQFLSQSNAVYPLLTDPNQLLGTNRPMVLENLNKTATLYVPEMIIAGDVDGDGIVNFTSRVDRTSTNAPFTFWINDDVDSGSDDAAQDLNPAEFVLDHATPSVGGLRDLEDFARLQFRIEGILGNLLTNAGLQTRVYLTNVTGNAGLRLFPAADANGGIGYLTNASSGNAQLAKSALGLLSATNPITLSPSNWQAQSTNRFFLPLIFEGTSTGKCIIVFGLASNTGPLLVTSRPFHLDLKRVTQMYEHWTVGDNTTTEWDRIPNQPVRTADSAVFGAPATLVERDYLLFVHGWRMQPWERRSFASTGFKRLWQLGYRGRYGLFSWPTDWIDTDLSNPTNVWNMIFSANRQNYDRSERRAWNAGKGLMFLLRDLERTHTGRVRLISHSMGGIPASEALRLRGQNPNRPAFVHTFIASQSASVAHAYDAVNPQQTSAIPLYKAFPRGNTSQPYFSGMRNSVSIDPTTLTRRIFNFHNQVDYALATPYVWPLNQTSKPDAGYSAAINGGPTLVTYFQNVQGYNRTLDPQIDAYEIFSYCAIASSRALGAAETNNVVVRGEVGGAVNLRADFNFQAQSYSHSAQFNSINMNRRLYWWQVLSTCSLTNGLSAP